MSERHRQQRRTERREERLDVGGELLPDRRMMSLIAPGASSGTAAADMLPHEAMQWHGPPDQMHIMEE